MSAVSAPLAGVEREVWFLTGSQGLYGPGTLAQVAEQSQAIAGQLAAAAGSPVRVVWKPVLTDAAAIAGVVLAANADDACVGLIAWMHTFSPAKMWIAGLDLLRKPLLHLHTQANVELPWSSIDMDFMNLNRLARFGDNMRDVAVTEGDKVEAQLRFGVSVNTYGVNDLVEAVDSASDAAVSALVKEYADTYRLAPELALGADRHDSLRYAARIELGLRSFLDDGGFGAFTTNFEDLGGLRQLPGLAVQRLMADGYGFGGEGDWKTATLLATVKAMGAGLPGGTSFMEDYTYHLVPGADMGDRFRLVANTIEVVPPAEPLPALPVARAVWRPEPDLRTSTEAWLTAGGPHHTVLSTAIGPEELTDLADILTTELLLIDNDTTLRRFTQEIRWNQAYYRLARGL